jgi:hypothetical protein
MAAEQRALRAHLNGTIATMTPFCLLRTTKSTPPSNALVLHINSCSKSRPPPSQHYLHRCGILRTRRTFLAWQAGSWPMMNARRSRSGADQGLERTTISTSLSFENVGWANASSILPHSRVSKASYLRRVRVNDTVSMRVDATCDRV